jgi:hypothetical protein
MELITVVMYCTVYSMAYTQYTRRKWSNSAFKTVAKVPQIHIISRCYHEGGAIEIRNLYYVKNKKQSSLIIPFI